MTALSGDIELILPTARDFTPKSFGQSLPLRDEVRP